MSQKDTTVVIDDVPRAQRWVWMEDWRSWIPFAFPLSFRGDFGWFPDVLNVKKTLLAEVSSLRAAFGPDDTAKLVIHGVHGDAFAESFRLNEDPKYVKLLPDNWAVNPNWALHVAVAWPVPDSSPSCDHSTSYNVKQQIATEYGDHDEDKHYDYKTRYDKTYDWNDSHDEQQQQHDKKRYDWDDSHDDQRQQRATSSSSTRGNQQHASNTHDHQGDQDQQESSRETNKSFETVEHGSVGKRR